jgi:hypothetical protein
VTADAFARELDLRLDDVPICFACLSFVSSAVDRGDEREIRSWTRQMTPDLWDEGLALSAQLAVARARRHGVPGAADALEDLELHGGRSATARAIVRRLAEELAALARRDRERMRVGRWRPEPG